MQHILWHRSKIAKDSNQTTGIGFRMRLLYLLLPGMLWHLSSAERHTSVRGKLANWVHLSNSSSGSNRCVHTIASITERLFSSGASHSLDFTPFCYILCPDLNLNFNTFAVHSIRLQPSKKPEHEQRLCEINEFVF